MVCLEDESDYDDDELDEDDEDYDENRRAPNREGPRIGQFDGFTGHNEEQEGRKATILEELWPHKKFGHDEITWLNPGGEEVEDCAYIAYGNQAELAWFYTSVVILITVPESSKRLPRDRVSSIMNLINIERNQKRTAGKDSRGSYSHPVEVDSSSPPSGGDDSVIYGGAARMSWC